MKRHASMNRVYRLVWSRVRNTWIAVAETARGRGKGSSRMLVAAALSLSAALAQAAPSGGQVAAGTGSISQSGATTTIRQASQNLSLNWASFNISPQETVNFLQPSAAAIAVNRISDTNGSQILGHLNANGQVWLINPNGILFGQGAQVNVGGLVASTLDLNDAGLSGNTRAFSGNGAGSVVNQGSITAADGGYVALLGNHVSNQGVISARLGTVALGAGSAATLSFSGNSLVKMQVDQSVLASLAENGGLINAGGGMVVMNAGAKNALLASVVNNTGIIEAKGVGSIGGVIHLEGDYVTQLGTLDASGNQGGTIALTARAILDAGTANVAGTARSGGNIDYAATDGIVQTAGAQLTANGAATGGTVHLQADNSLFSSAVLSATGQHGGTLDALGNNVILAAASLDASGATQGGLIRVGGDFHGANPNIVNAQTTIINGATRLKADGGKGKVVVWSDQQTNVFGNISANQAGNIEVSSKGTLDYAGTADAGAGGSLLLDPANIVISDAGGPAAFALLDPHAAAGNQFGNSTTVLGTTVNGVFTENGKIVITSPNDDLGAINAGAAYLFDTNTGALLSTLTGSLANDYVGSNNTTALTNGNYVVGSYKWNGNRGAATWGDGVNGISGAVSASNSLVGTTANDYVSGLYGYGIIALANGSYVVDSSEWNGSRGAATWGDGTTGISGAVSASNSLVGTTANDRVAGDHTTALTNGNYVVRSPDWDYGLVTNAGAATWGNGTTGISGAVSATNSLVGTNAGDRVSLTAVTALTNGNYVVAGYNWNGDRGAATWGNGATGISGAVSATNSLVGTTATDQVGALGVVALTNGNYVVGSPIWHNGLVTNAGAATWGDGTTGISGAVSATNSLVGTAIGDRVGNYRTAALANGNYVVLSSEWNGTTGAATFGNGTTGISGAVSASNSLVGTNAGDSAGIDVTALTNGNYVVSRNYWDNGSVQDAGAATFGSGVTGISGTVSATNSLVGTTANDGVGSATKLTNGNYVVNSYGWNGSRGAVTLGDGTSGISGAVSASNSLVGTTANDYVGGWGITALTNGNYVVGSSSWNGNRGAVTLGNGTIGTTGAVSATNSLVGTTADDYVGFDGVTALTNGNYVVRSSQWNGTMGAVTWGRSTTGVIGAVTATNSLVGMNVGDSVGSYGVIALANGNYVVSSAGYAANAGQVLIGTPFNIYFANGTGQNMTFNPSGLAGTLAGGTAVTLQASNDITVNSAITVGGGAGGTLTFQAGRNINLNSTLTTANGDFTAIAADAGAIGADLQAGTPAITLGVGASIDAGTGTVTLAVDGGNFINNSISATPISASRWLVYSTSPAGSTENGLTAAAGSTLPRLYNKTYAGNAPATIAAGNHLIYSAQPTLTVTADDKARTYGDANPSFTATTTGFVSDDGVTDTPATAGITGATALSSLATAISPVSSSPFTISAAVGDLASSAGYNFGFIDGGLTINKAHLTVTADDKTRLYGAINPTLSNTVSGFVNGENAGTAAGYGGTANVTTLADATTNVGTAPITASAGNLIATNYDFTAANGILTIDKAHLTVTADDKTRLYGAVNPTLTNSVSGFVNNESASNAAGYSGVANITTLADATTSVGTAPIAAAAGTLAAINYDFTATNGTLTINKAQLTVTANDQSRLYGQVNPALTTTVSGFLNGETAGTAAGFAGAGSATTAANATTNVGTAPITASAGNLIATNYDFTAANGILTIDKAHLTVTADDKARLYGAVNPTLTNSVSGFVNNESASSAAGYSGVANITTLADATTNAGTALITAGTGNLAASNYDFAAANGTLTIDKAHLTVTADDKTRLYGAANPILTSTVSGFVNGENAGTAAGFTGAGSATTLAGATTNVGTAPITASAGNLIATNYDFTAANGILTIDKAHLTVTADDKARLYGAVNPILTSTVSGFVNGETAGTAAGFTGSGGATATADATTNIGTALITAAAGNLAATDYDFTRLVDGTLTIDAAIVPLIPTTPTPMADTPVKPLETAPAQLQSSILAPQASTKPEEISLSPTLTVTQSSSSDTAAAGDASSPDTGDSSAVEPRWRVAIAGGDASSSGSGNGTVVNTMMTIGGGTGPSLQIVNGGMKLPENMVNMKKEQTP